MKKSLLAIAAMTAFAGAAQAQSSVTIYGVMDVGVMGQSNSNMLNGSTGGEYTVIISFNNNSLCLFEPCGIFCFAEQLDRANLVQTVLCPNKGFRRNSCHVTPNDIWVKRDIYIVLFIRVKVITCHFGSKIEVDLCSAVFN